MPEEMKLIQRVTVERDQDGWWSHPDEPDFDEDLAAFKAWLVQQGLELTQWHMDADIDGHHPYEDGECHCLGWEPVAPGPEWFLLGIFDTEDGPCVSWARRKPEEVWSLSGENGSWDYPSLTALIRDNYGHDCDSAGMMSDGGTLVIGSTVHRGIVCRDDPARFLPDADDVANHMFEQASCSDAGEWVDNYPELNGDAEEALKQALEPLKAWARLYCQPKFFTVKNVTTHELTDEDVRDAMSNEAQQ